jgi:hypothetical protein
MNMAYEIWQPYECPNCGLKYILFQGQEQVDYMKGYPILVERLQKLFGVSELISLESETHKCACGFIDKLPAPEILDSDRYFPPDSDEGEELPF